MILASGAATPEQLRTRDARGDSALDHAVGERQWRVARQIVDAFEAAGGFADEPALAALAARVAEHEAHHAAKPAAPKPRLSPAEAYARNKAILDERKRARD